MFWRKIISYARIAIEQQLKFSLHTVASTGP